ncbi:MAG TPA: hypothetical protein VNL14_15110 [Candidatus Acidoferrales bacterium]|nr:hypothetical protein [Candidatus Acidoferrales bacterium]
MSEQAKKTPNLRQGLDAPGGTGVLNSVESLQQIVQALSSEEILEFERRIDRLIAKLKSLADALSRAAAAKRFAIAADALLSGASTGASDAAPAKSPAAAPSNVIRFRGEARNSPERAQETSPAPDLTPAESRLPAQESGASARPTAGEDPGSPPPGREGTAPEGRGKKEDSVPTRFFETMRERLTECVGPMAPIIIDDCVAALGESRSQFPRARLFELVKLASDEIADPRLRGVFQVRLAEEARRLGL